MIISVLCKSNKRTYMKWSPLPLNINYHGYFFLNLNIFLQIAHQAWTINTLFKSNQIRLFQITRSTPYNYYMYYSLSHSLPLAWLRDNLSPIYFSASLCKNVQIWSRNMSNIIQVNVCAGSSTTKFVYKSQEDQDEANSCVCYLFRLRCMIIV